MKVAVFSTKAYDRRFLQSANEQFHHELTFFEPRLTLETASLAHGFEAVCAFVNDLIDAPVLSSLANNGVRCIALRSAGFNNVDLAQADRLGLPVVRVPAYSPHAVAEYTVCLMLALNRKIHRAYNRVREGNFSLEGLLGFDMCGRTVGIVGTGQIGAVVARIVRGFQCKVLAYDLQPNAECVELGAEYVSVEELFRRSDIITLHCPLTPQTRYLINESTIQLMKPGVMLINTSRGAVIDTRAAVSALKSGQIGALGLDVYEEEVEYFFEDHSAQLIEDDVLARLLTFPNVVVSSHQAFFTHEALEAIATTTLRNLQDIELGRECVNQLRKKS